MVNEQACKTPLVELLRAVPRDAMWVFNDVMSSSIYPVGRLCHEAADASGEEKLQEVVSTLRAAWGAVGIADRVFDDWWIDYGRPLLDAYVREVKAADAWIPPA